jgi:phosphoribosyl 1,2-cyclic phosphodiesterase
VRWESQSLLIDCGFAPRELEQRFERARVPLDSVAAIFLTHEHRDHVAGLPLFSPRAHLKLHGTRGTLRKLRWSSDAPCKTQRITQGQTVQVGAFSVRAVPVSHNAGNPVGYVVELPDERRIGFLTDLGCVTKGLVQALGGCDVLALEANHDPELLRLGPYPQFLKQRVRSRRGHLSNEQAADLLAQVASERTQHVYALHISDANNRPELAVRVLETCLAARGLSVPVTAVVQHELTHYPPPGQLSLF